MNWRVLVTGSAKKQLKRIARTDVEWIKVTIGEMKKNPFVGDISKLEGESDRWRKRIGSYRILY